MLDTYHVPLARPYARGLMDEPYIRLEDFGGGTGSYANTAALNAAVEACRATGTRVIRLGAGIYRFYTKPADFTTGVVLLGESMSVTSLMRCYSASGPDEGFLTWSGSGSNGGGVANALVQTDSGFTNGTMVKFTTPVDDIAGYHFMHGVVVTHVGTGWYHRCLLVDGVLNDVSGSQGLRDFNGYRLFLFKPTSGTESARFINATNMIALGVWANGNVVITGGGTALTNTNYARIDLHCLAQLFVSESTYVSAVGVVSTLNFSTNSNTCMFTGVVTTSSGGVSNTGTNNRYLAPGYGT